MSQTNKNQNMKCFDCKAAYYDTPEQIMKQCIASQKSENKEKGSKHY